MDSEFMCTDTEGICIVTNVPCFSKSYRGHLTLINLSVHQPTFCCSYVITSNDL